MRYAEPTQLGPGGFSAVPEVPSLPPMPQIQIGDRPPEHFHGAPMPIMGDGFHDGTDYEQEPYYDRPSNDSVRSGTESFARDPAIDLNLLSQDDFDPQACKLSLSLLPTLRFPTAISSQRFKSTCQI